MLNEEKVILMTQMASYEENEGKKNMAIEVLKSILCATIAYGVCFALFVFYDFENFMQDIYKMDLIGFGKNVLLYYGITVVVYGVASYLICSLRYARAKKSLKCYYNNLKKLNSIYNE